MVTPQGCQSAIPFNGALGFLGRERVCVIVRSYVVID